LLVEPVYKDYWEIVGGCVEENESPRQAAMREMKEELGMRVPLGRLLVVDWVPPRTDRTEGVMFVYDGGTLDKQRTADIYLPAAELTARLRCASPLVAGPDSHPVAVIRNSSGECSGRRGGQLAWGERCLVVDGGR
jgi:hypothetical protein